MKPTKKNYETLCKELNNDYKYFKQIIYNVGMYEFSNICAARIVKPTQIKDFKPIKVIDFSYDDHNREHGYFILNSLTIRLRFHLSFTSNVESELGQQCDILPIDEEEYNELLVLCDI